MTSSIICHAAVAIVYQKGLVYARGFTLAGPYWLNAEPPTRFRLASCSKFITALSIFQLIQENKLKPADKVRTSSNFPTPAIHPSIPTETGGIVACWGGDPVTAPWYPYYLEIFSPDKDVLQSGKDLFPHYGMP
jgi:hypothetical protein